MIAVFGCQGCGACMGLCEAIIFDDGKVMRIDSTKCNECYECIRLCPHGALIL